MRRRNKTQAAPEDASAPLPVGRTRRGLASLRERVIVRRLAAALATPAAAPVVAVLVVGVFAALAVGFLLGVALAARNGAGESW